MLTTWIVSDLTAIVRTGCIISHKLLVCKMDEHAKQIYSNVLSHTGELTVETFLEKVKGKASLLPLLPLTAGGNEPAAVDIMIEELIAAEKTDLLWIGYVLAAKVFDQNDLQWLKRRFALMNDFLRDSPVYQE